MPSWNSVANVASGATIQSSHMNDLIADVAQLVTLRSSRDILIGATVLAADATTVTHASIPGTYQNLAHNGNARGASATTLGNIGMVFNNTTGSEYHDLLAAMWTTSNSAATGGSATTTAEVAGIPGSSSPSDSYNIWRMEIDGYEQTDRFVTYMTNWFVYYDTNTARRGWYGGEWRPSTKAAVTEIDFDGGGAGDFEEYSEFRLYGNEPD